MSIPNNINLISNNDNFINQDIINIFKLNDTINENPDFYTNYKIIIDELEYDISQVFILNNLTKITDPPPRTGFTTFINEIEYDLSDIFLLNDSITQDFYLDYKNNPSIIVDTKDNNNGPTYAIFDSDSIGGSSFPKTFTLTATKDCQVIGYLIGHGGTGSTGEDQYIGGGGGAGSKGVEFNFFIKENESITITFNQSDNHDTCLKYSNLTYNSPNGINAVAGGGGSQPNKGGNGGTASSTPKGAGGTGKGASSSSNIQNIIKTNSYIDNNGNTVEIFTDINNQGIPPAGFGSGGGGGNANAFNQINGVGEEVGYGKTGFYTTGGWGGYYDGDKGRDVQYYQSNPKSYLRNYGAGSGGMMYGGLGVNPYEGGIPGLIITTQLTSNVINYISGDYIIDAFGSNQIMVKFLSGNNVIKFSKDITFSTLIVAGGGGGGYGYGNITNGGNIVGIEGPGGGGAGGLGWGDLVFKAYTTYNLNIGEGGKGGYYYNTNYLTAENGTSSTITGGTGNGAINEEAFGGGYGGSSIIYYGQGGGNGGSGGGSCNAWDNNTGPGTDTTGKGILKYLGQNGGNGLWKGCGGGGGGAYSAGADAIASSNAGNGGDGYKWNNEYYAGGGGGGGTGSLYNYLPAGSGGSSIGGNGGYYNSTDPSSPFIATDGTKNTGSGGGGGFGGSGTSKYINGGNGGSGIIILVLSTL